MRLKKNTILVSVFIVLLLLLAGCGSNSQPAANQGAEKTNDAESGITEQQTEPITLKLATFMPVEHPWTKAVTDPFMARVTELTDGQVQFEYYPAQQLGKAADLLMLAGDGVTDIAMTSNIYFPSQMSLASALTGMPGLFEDAYHGSMAYLKVAQQSPMLESDFLAHGVRPLLTTISPGYDFFTDGKEIKKPEDVKGMKLRAGGGVMTELLNFAGATPVQMTVADSFSGFEKGVIDGLHFYYTAIQNFGMGELVTYATHGVNSGGGPSEFVINEEVFQSLPKNVQDALMQAGLEATESGGKAEQSNNLKFLEEFKSSGNIKVHELTDEEKAAWNDLYNEFNKSWIEKQNNPDFIEYFGPTGPLG